MLFEFSIKFISRVGGRGNLSTFFFISRLLGGLEKLKTDFEFKPPEKTSVMLFGKKDCPLCRRAKKILERIESGAGDIEKYYFDVDTLEGLSKAAYHNALDVPVLIVFKNGREIKRWREEDIPEESSIKNFL